MRLSIRLQLLLPLVTLMVGVVAMSTWMALAAAGRARRHIETQMDNVAATVRDVTFPRNQQTLNLMKRLSGAEFILCDAHRQPLLDDQGRPIATLAGAPERLPEVERLDAHPLGQRVVVGDHVYFTRGISLGEDVSANLTLYVLYAESLWRDALWQHLWPALFLGILGGVISIALTVAVTQRLTRRIQELERRTRLIAAGDFSPMPLPRRDDELRDLGTSVNDMAERLAQFQETARKTERLRLLGQVSGGLAHQLRNGAAAHRLAVQLHARACAADAESLAVALQQLVLMETYLKRFLDLGKATELSRQPCDLRDLVRDAVALLRPQSRHAGIALRHHESDASLTTSGDASHLGQLLVNVLTNAVEAAGPGGRVDVCLGQTASGRVFVEVVDTGPGPPAHVAERLFEPFVTGKPEGVGLGLAVARQVAEAHGGSIRWFRKPEGTCFRIELPPAAQPSALMRTEEVLR